MTRPHHLCQLAGTWNGRTVPAGGCMAEEKIDGWRALYFRGRDGQPNLWTRNGFAIEGVGHILHRLALLEQMAGVPMMFDGEFQVGGTLAATKAWCERGWKLGGEAGTFHAFDALPDADWQQGGSSTPLHVRKQMLATMMREADAAPLSWEWREGTRGREPDGPAVVLVKDEWCADMGDVLDLANRVWSADGEGVVLKIFNSPYQRNRNDAWLKVKHPNYVPGYGLVYRKAA
jgi:ATP-dependent DNA ligase